MLPEPIRRAVMVPVGSVHSTPIEDGCFPRPRSPLRRGRRA